MTTLSDVEYPVVVFGRPKCPMEYVKSRSELESAHYNSVSAMNGMNELFLVDSRGRKYSLGDVALMHKPGPIRRLLHAFTDPVVTIVFRRIQPEGEMALEEFRDRMLLDLDENRDYWADLSTYEDLQARMRTRRSVTELIELLKGL